MGWLTVLRTKQRTLHSLSKYHFLIHCTSIIKCDGFNAYTQTCTIHGLVTSGTKVSIPLVLIDFWLYFDGQFLSFSFEYYLELIIYIYIVRIELKSINGSCRLLYENPHHHPSKNRKLWYNININVHVLLKSIRLSQMKESIWEDFFFTRRYIDFFLSYWSSHSFFLHVSLLILLKKINYTPAWIQKKWAINYYSF